MYRNQGKEVVNLEEILVGVVVVVFLIAGLVAYQVNKFVKKYLG